MSLFNQYETDSEEMYKIKHSSPLSLSQQQHPHRKAVTLETVCRFQGDGHLQKCMFFSICLPGSYETRNEKSCFITSYQNVLQRFKREGVRDEDETGAHFGNTENIFSLEILDPNDSNNEPLSNKRGWPTFPKPAGLTGAYPRREMFSSM